jgi:hypothetical protein
VGQNFLLISSRPDDEAFSTEVAKATGTTLITVPNPVEAVNEVIAKDGAGVVMVDVSTEEHYRAFEQAVANSVGLLSGKINANAVHFITSRMIEESKYLIESQLFGHYILRNYQDPREAGEHYARIVAGSLGDQLAFGLQRLLKPGTKIQTLKLQQSNQKQDAVEAVRKYLVAAKFQTRMATIIANAVDETLMNAMFDAPVDELGRQIYSSTSRATVLPLEGKSAVEMHIGWDGNCVGITVTDYFGSLDKLKLLGHIAKIYTDEEYKVKTSVAGAGIGLATVFRSGGSFFFASESGTKTEVTVFFRRTDNFRLFKDQFRFLSTQFYF